MNFYTLDYDCNTPVTQQINVPTNTDYKVGIKVKKDGQDINLQPSQLTVGDYTMDDTKTNGYVTYKASTGDDAEYKQLDVKVETEAPTKFEDTRTASAATANVICRVMEAQLSAYGGQKLYAKDIHLFQSNDNVNWREVLDSSNNINYIRLTVDKTSTYAVKYLTTVYPYIEYGKWATWPDPQDEENIVWSDYVEIPTSNPRILTSIFPNVVTVPDGSQFTYPCYFKLTVQIGADQIVANFKLNLNAHKSQKGDINLVGRASTVNFAGTDGQGKAFSYDVIVK